MGDRPFAVGVGFGVLLSVLAYVQGWVWFPDQLTWEFYALIGTCVVVCLANYANEYHQFYPLQYSKFAADGGVPARLGWFIMYFTPMLVYIIVWSCIPNADSSYDYLVLAMYCAHFLKRCLEVIFVHKYSKDCLLQTVIEIASFYSLGAVVTAYSCHSLAGEPRFSFLDDMFRVKVGLCIYGFGQLCNLLHHYILANLREPGSFRYVVPSGGLFSMVVCPQYFGELMSWLGFAITSYQYGAYLSYIPMVVYLCARAHHTYRWYATKFDNYPGSGTLKLWPIIY